MREVNEVSCFADEFSSLEIDTEDTAAILLRFVTGSIGEIRVDYIQLTYSRTCRLIGEEGTIHWNYTEGNVNLFSPKERIWKVDNDTSDWDSNKKYIDELRYFRFVRKKEKSDQDVCEGKKVLEVALTAHKSAKMEMSFT